MYSQVVSILAIIAMVEARFGQEQVPVAAIQAVTSGGGSGVAATLAGGSISTILAASNSCDKLTFADKIIAELGTGADAVTAAQGLVAAEKNFNPFAASIPTVCSDPTLPTTAVLRGITPKIDPAVGGSALANQLSAQSLKAPFQADGMSVADLLIANGFSNFTKQASSGTTAAVSTSAGNTGAATPPPAGANSTASSSSSVAAPPPATDCNDVPPPPPPPPCNAAPPTATTFVTVAVAAATPAANASANTGASSSSSSSTQSSLGISFGKCTPTIAFEGGLGGRPATEFTFQIIDPLARGGQEEALNPNIISSALCNQLINVCGVAKGDAGETACLQAKAAMQAAGTRDASTAENWNNMLGFAGVSITPAIS
ncbi:hypothetical protein MMC25_003033 [Agyrium rufum]|nr:hypothetical protein [Agyrium rufum]